MAKRVDVGLTGGIACGKTAAAGILAEAGAAVLDTDRVAHEVMAPGGPAYEAVIEAFGSEIVAADGTIDRAVLGEKVFGDAAVRLTLNGLVHPAVRDRRRAWVLERRAQEESTVVAIPLLFEVGDDQEWDAIVCVTADESTVMERLKHRGLSDAQARRRIAAQMPVEEKAARSDYVIENNGSLDKLKRLVLSAWNEIGKEE
jgi:dephospho-CoA kinase